MRRRAPLAAVLVTAAALFLAGCGSTPTGSQSASTTTTPAPAVMSVDPATVRPIALTIPSLHVSSTLVPVGLTADRELQTPPVTEPGQAAWYDQSEVPGNNDGIPSTLLGHINGGGQDGVFAHLTDLRPTAEVDVARSDGTTAVFTVRRVDVVPKAQFPTDAVYSHTGNAQARLISCAGDLDRTGHDYLSQVIVYADLQTAHRT